MASDYRVKIEAELQEICHDVLVRTRFGNGRQAEEERMDQRMELWQKKKDVGGGVGERVFDRDDKDRRVFFFFFIHHGNKK